MGDKTEITPRNASRKDNVEWILKTILQLPRSWLLISSIFVLLSMFNVGWTPQKGLSLAFQVTTTTAIFFALIWLPVLLGIFALVGGGVKTPAGEFTSSGLSTFLQHLESDTLGVLIEDTSRTHPGQNTTQANQFQKEVRDAYVARISKQEAREELLRLADLYNKLRIEMQPGSERNLQMRSLSGRIRALAPIARLSPKEIYEYLQSDNGGKRILALNASKVIGANVKHFEPILHIIGNPQSAYEQYQALSIMLDMTSVLNQEQKERLVEILNKQREYDEQKKQWIRPYSDRRRLSDQILSAISRQND